jgi:hypothetical protein
MWQNSSDVTINNVGRGSSVYRGRGPDGRGRDKCWKKREKREKKRVGAAGIEPETTLFIRM